VYTCALAENVVKLEGAHAVVTGGASGIGRALALRFAAEGARALTVADLDEAGARAVAAEVGGLGLRVDVAREADVQALVDAAERAHGPIDLFCSNAGLFSAGGVEASNADWERHLAVHVLAHVYAARAVLPGMIARGSGYLLQTASAAGLLTQIGSAPYAVTKHAAVALAEWLAIEHHHQGIRVSVLCPQAVRTAMTAGTDGGVAGVDGMIEADEVARCVVEALAEERFLILPHPEVREYVQRKAGDRERWLAGMRRLRERFGGLAALPSSASKR
jgi:NAD(P)-dependent dehydrogenase (short-subunit alcohol dehydrogenase family)